MLNMIPEPCPVEPQYIIIDENSPGSRIILDVNVKNKPCRVNCPKEIKALVLFNSIKEKMCGTGETGFPITINDAEESDLLNRCKKDEEVPNLIEKLDDSKNDLSKVTKNQSNLIENTNQKNKKLDNKKLQQRKMNI